MRRYCIWHCCEFGLPLAIFIVLGWLAARAGSALYRIGVRGWTALVGSRASVLPHAAASGILEWERSLPVPLLLVKLIAFVLVLATLYVVARVIAQRKQRSAGSKQAQPAQPAPHFPIIIDTALRAPAEASPPSSPSASAQFYLADDGLCVPPRIHAYHFRHTDLVRGPADPHDFYDDFFVEMEDPADHHRYTEQFTIATPAGITRLMRAEGVAHLFPDGFIVVSNFNLGEILTAIVSRYADFRGVEPVTREHSTR